MTSKTLFLGWQDKRLTGEWFPIGRLDVYQDDSSYRFRYIKGAKSAENRVGLKPLMNFPQWNSSYESSVLFPLFRNRVMQAVRPDYPEYLRMLDLPDCATPADILAVSGGERATDHLDVFPRVERRPDGFFYNRFFLHGWRSLNAEVQSRVASFRPGEGLHLTIEQTYPTAQLAAQIHIDDDCLIGWAPRYLSDELVHLIGGSSTKYTATVVRVNPAPAPAAHRVLIELKRRGLDYRPMSSEDFEPLTP